MSGLRRRDLLRWGAFAALAACTSDRDAAPTTPRTITAAPSTPRSSVPDTPSATPTAPSPAPTTPAPAPRPVRVPLVCRDAWGARPPGAGLQPHAIDRLTVHHSAVVTTDRTQGPGHLRQYQDLHMDSRGWPDIAYHVAVDRAGVAYQLRDWDTVGDTATDYDPAGHFLLLLDGSFSEQGVADAQFATAARVLAWATDHFGVPLAETSGHRDHAITACPGDALYARLGELVARAREARDTGPVELVTRCGGPARAAVEELERGGMPDLLT